MHQFDARNTRVLHYAVSIGVGAVIALCATLSAAQSYPNHPIRFILPYSAGGSYDAIARMIGQGLAEKWGQQVVVDNRPGAAGRIGMELAVNAAPDGYTFIMLGNNQTIASIVYKKVPYDLLKDLAPVAMLATITDVLTVHPSVPVKTVTELVALAKAKPGTINFASGGTGGITHLAGELFKSMSGANIVHVPYKGGAFAMIGVLSGQAQMMVLNMLNAVPNINANKLHGLGVTSLQRSAYIPQLPTLDETGLKGYEVIEWYGVAVPRRTPKEIVAQISGEMSRLLKSDEIKEKLAIQYADASWGSPEQLGSFIRADLEKYRKIVKDAGITPE